MTRPLSPNKGKAEDPSKKKRLKLKKVKENTERE
jgi:hypothetical protein